MGGMDDSISSVGMGVVLNALVMRHSALFCMHSRVFFMTDDFLSQNAMLPHVIIGSMAHR